MRRFRYTGKFFRYAYLILIPFMAVGFSDFIKKIPSKRRMTWIVSGAALLTLVQLHVMRPLDDLASTKTVFLPGSYTELVGAAHDHPANPPRILVCPTDESLAPGVVMPWFDLKHRGVPMVKSMDAAEMPMIRALDCSWVKHAPILAAFGISHLIVPTPEKGRTLVTLAGTNPATGHVIDRAKLESVPEIREVGPFENYNLSWGTRVESMQTGTVFIDSSHVLAADGRPIATSAGHVKNLIGSTQCQTPDCPANFDPVPLTLNLTNDRIQSEVSAARDSILILPWSSLAGWYAMVDAKPVEILRINAAVIGIPLAPGVHQIELRFMPRGLVPLLWISITSQIAVLLSILFNLRTFFYRPVLEFNDSLSRDQ